MANEMKPGKYGNLEILPSLSRSFGSLVVLGGILAVTLIWIAAHNARIDAGNEVPLEMYLKLKDIGIVDHVFLEGDGEGGTLTAHLHPGLILDGGMREMIRCDVPPAYMNDPDKFRELAEGLAAPEKLNYKR